MGAGDAIRSGINDRAFDLQVRNADCGELRQILIDRVDECFGSLQPL